MIKLIDDGTLDTVLRCSECGEELRYNYDGPDTVEGSTVDEAMEKLADADQQYREFVEWAIEDATIAHKCRTEEQE